MGGRSWTELFFLDEATAFAAGHRPCFYCRRDDANRFRAAWEEGNGVTNILAPRDRCGVAPRAAGRRQEAAASRCRCRWKQLPDGAMVQAGERELSDRAGQGAAVVARPAIARHADARSRRDAADAAVDVARVGAGYRPVLHPSAAQPSAQSAVIDGAHSARIAMMRLRTPDCHPACDAWHRQACG